MQQQQPKPRKVKTTLTKVGNVGSKKVPKPRVPKAAVPLGQTPIAPAPRGGVPITPAVSQKGAKQRAGINLPGIKTR